MSDELSSRTPRQVVIFQPPGGTLTKHSYPWLHALRVTIVGGQGSPSKSGDKGQPGEMRSEVLYAADDWRTLQFYVGRGGVDSVNGAGAGDDGYALVELFDAEPL